MRKDRLDGTGLGALLAVSLLLAFNQIIVKYVNQGLQPVFFAGLRSALAVVFVGGWLWYRGLIGRVRLADLAPGLLMGAIFALEFLALFLALDLTTVGRSALIMYSMPVWLGLAGHFFLPGERLTGLKAAGLGLAFAGTAWAILSKNASGVPSLTGDLCALVAA
jgi:drug/metabolite transporter (DMT)-like permease